MSPDKERKLYETFPEIYAQKDWPMTDSLMCFGFDCGDGWYDIIYRLSQELMRIKKKDPKLCACTHARKDHLNSQGRSGRCLSCRGWMRCSKYRCLSSEQYPQAAQVKEKFGELRFYAGPTTPSMNEAIDAATEESQRTCEECGSKERVNVAGRYWIRSLCHVCRVRVDGATYAEKLLEEKDIVPEVIPE